MNHATALLWWYLNVLTKRRYDAICEIYGSIDAATKHIGEEFLRGLGMREEALRAALMRLEEFDAEKMEATMQARNISLLTIEESSYPATLREVPDAPVFMSYRGDLSTLDRPLIGVVGTRGMSHYGKRVAGRFVPVFVQGGMVTVSGLALGIDTAVARETLGAGGRTVAVLGHGLAQIFPPSNAKLAEEIVAKGGLLLSEFPPDQTPDTYTFPARNRLIAGLTLATVVLEAPEGSGALITADLALDYGRDVFVVPGDIFSPNYAGSHAFLIKGQGQLVTDPDEVLRSLGIRAPAAGAAAVEFHASSPTEQAVWEALSSLPQKIDDLVERTGMKSADIAAQLTMMEIGGVVKNVGRGEWVRK